MKGFLLVPGILNLVTSATFITLSGFENLLPLVLGIFLIITGVLCIMYSNMDVEKVYEKRSMLLFFGITLIPFNLISAILLLIGVDKVKVEYAKILRGQDIQVLDTENTNVKLKQEVGKGVKKVDILLKLGIVMVAVAGFMIATTSWNVITDFVKMLIITVIGFVFLGLSFFSDKKLKIRGTTITYWLLSMIAFSLAIFMLGYYEMLGNWFSFAGDGGDLFVASLVLCISLFSYITYKKFDMPVFVYIAYLGMLIAIALATRSMSHKKELCLLVITIFVTITNFLPKSENKELKAIRLFGLISSFVITALLIFLELNMDNELVILVTLLLQFINLINITLSERKSEISLLSAVSIICLGTATLSKINWNLDDIYASLINRSIILLMGIILCMTLLKNKTISNILFAIVLPLAIISIIFNIDVIVGIYIGIMTLAMIIVGTIKKEFKAIYVEGIVFLIADLLIQFWNFWGFMPVWAYLLIGGLTLIGIVTYKELKKENKDIQ